MVATMTTSPPQPPSSGQRRPYRPTVEIPCLILYFGITVTGTLMANVLIHRTCVHQLGHSDQYCQRLQDPGEKPPELQDLETEVQRFTTVVSTVKSVIDAIIPAVLALFLGSWSNTYGRKPLIVAPVIGFAISMVLLTAYSYVGSLGPWWYLVTALPYSLVGGIPAFMTGAFCLLNDVSTERDRTFRLSLLMASMFTGMIFGSMCNFLLYEALGTIIILIIATCLSIISIVYSVLCIQESVPKTESGSGLSSVLDISRLKEMLRVCVVRRPNYGRLILLLLIAANTLDLAVVHVVAVEYLYVRQKLSWTLLEQNVFTTVNTFVLVLGIVFGVLILQRLCKLGDEATTVISFVSCMLEGIARALAYAAWVMYFGSVISAFRGLSFALVRSMVSKRVGGEDVARLFSLMSVLEAMLPLFVPLFYNTLYRQTLATLPGAVYFFNSALYAVCIVLMCVAWRVMARHPLPKDSPLRSQKSVQESEHLAMS